MYSFRRILVSTLVGVTLLANCGGDIHEAKVKVSSPTSVSKNVKKRTKVSPPKVPQTTTTTTIDPEVLKFNLVVYGNELARQEAEKEKARVQQTAQPSQNHPNSHGGHSDAWWHGVSVCEQGGRNDSYFGYFSYMDGSAGGKSWSEQVAMGNATVARYGEDMMYGGAWAHKCVLAGYSASPNG